MTRHLPSSDTDEPGEATGSSGITRFLGGGDRFGRATLSTGQGGIELRHGRFLVDSVTALAELGHAIATRFDPPQTADIQAVGLRSGELHTWPDVARAALTRPVTVYIADTTTCHYDWVGTGFTEDEARDSLMGVWLRHAEQTGADPDHIRRDELRVRHGVTGTAWRDDHAFPPRTAAPNGTPEFHPARDDTAPSPSHQHRRARSAGCTPTVLAAWSAHRAVVNIEDAGHRELLYLFHADGDGVEVYEPAPEHGWTLYSRHRLATRHEDLFVLDGQTVRCTGCGAVDQVEFFTTPSTTPQAQTPVSAAGTATTRRRSTPCSPPTDASPVTTPVERRLP